MWLHSSQLNDHQLHAGEWKRSHYKLLTTFNAIAGQFGTCHSLEAGLIICFWCMHCTPAATAVCNLPGCCASTCIRRLVVFGSSRRQSCLKWHYNDWTVYLSTHWKYTLMSFVYELAILCLWKGFHVHMQLFHWGRCVYTIVTVNSPRLELRVTCSMWNSSPLNEETCQCAIPTP